VYRKVVLALMLVLHYSLAFGAIENAAMPDEHHPFGKSVPHSHLHHPTHQDTHDHRPDFGMQHEHDHEHSPVSDHVDSLGSSQGSLDNAYEHQHTHTITIQLNIDVPGIIAVDFFKPDIPSVTPYQLDHNSLSYPPTVPPPLKR
jgi:hypothetical protein